MRQSTLVSDVKSYTYTRILYFIVRVYFLPGAEFVPPTTLLLADLNDALWLWTPQGMEYFIKLKKKNQMEYHRNITDVPREIYVYVKNVGLLARFVNFVRDLGYWL